MIRSTYIHIPFCRRKCNYCSFISYDKLNLESEYIEALIREINSNYKNERLNTLYIGGGTPSLIKLKNLEKILSKFKFDNNCEITIEVNPENINKDYLKGLKELGINRLSFGVQSFQDDILKGIGRFHNAREAKEAILLAKDLSFNNISLDLIYGLPYQNILDFENSLKEALELNINHISLYGLKIEEGCYYYDNPPKELPSLDLQEEMYNLAIDFLESKRYIHYEISNFALEGYEAAHNMNYWNNREYYGFGVSASGYINKTQRYTNTFNIEEYINNPLEAKKEIYNLTKINQLEEEIFLGLRKLSGININDINIKFNIDFEKKYREIIKKYNKEFLQKTDIGYRLTRKGILLSNNILCEFLED